MPSAGLFRADLTLRRNGITIPIMGIESVEQIIVWAETQCGGAGIVALVNLAANPTTPTAFRVRYQKALAVLITRAVRAFDAAQRAPFLCAEIGGRARQAVWHTEPSTSRYQPGAWTGD